jgi:hypothetical protein
MGSFSIILNLITILLVSALFYVGITIYRTREDKAMGAMEIFDRMLIDPDTVTHAYMTSSKVGPIGNFVSYSWDRVESSSISELPVA